MRALISIPFLSALAGSALAETTSYDYVVVGSGPGGGTLAANLARNGSSVFLIEAGGNHGDEFIQQVPAFADANAEAPGMSWQFFVSHYQNDTQAQRDRYFTYRLENGSYWYGGDPPEGATPLGIYYPRGATVGGSAISNAMNVVLPPDSDWDAIVEATGDDSWSAENMRQYFIELERNTYVPEGTPGHGFKGYISTNRNNISYVVDRPGVLEFASHAVELTDGVESPSREDVIELLERDLNRPDGDRYEIPGMYQIPLHIDENRRRSSPWNIVSETLAARNDDGSSQYPLTLSTDSLATRVLMRKNCTSGIPKAYAVEYLVGEGLYEADQRYNADDQGELKVVHAKKEVIIAGGAFNSPQLLKLSGLGPQAELEEHGIPVVVDLPAVGEYLQDNYEIGINALSSVPWENNPAADCMFDPTGSPETDPCLAQWDQGYGFYGEGAAPLFSLFRTTQSENNDTDIIAFAGMGGVFDGHYPGFSTTQWPAESVFVAAVKMQNQNPSGTVRLRSADPRHVPEIDLNFFEEGRETDLQALSEALEHYMGVLQAMGEPYAPFEIIDPPTDRSLSQHILDHSWSHHVVGSCRMGATGANETSVVGPDFKVHGVEGLRVVDGSVFTRAPGGFPVGATYAISRKAFHDIASN